MTQRKGKKEKEKRKKLHLANLNKEDKMMVVANMFKKGKVTYTKNTAVIKI